MKTSAIVTASWWKDVDRFRLLAESVERWVPAEVQHYVFVTRSDLALFRPFENARTHVVVVEEVLPRWLVRLPWRSPFWLSLRTPPVKNWILQQIVKLSMPAALTEDVLWHVDSDMFFIREWDPSAWITDGRTPLYVHTGNHGLLPEHVVWHDGAARLLGLPEEHDDDRNYVRPLIPWDRRIALEMLEHVERVKGRSWQQVVAREWQFSEYTLYGEYAERVVADPSRLRPYGTAYVAEHWTPEPLDAAGLRALVDGIEPHQVALLIQSKSETPVDLIREVVLSR